MAEITDFPERRSQISIVADEIGKELKEMQRSKTVGPQNQRLIEIFGGRNIPRKFTFAHMQELLKDMSPVAGDENTIFILSQIIEEKFPGTIDKKDFADFEERFGSVLDTQNAGNLVDLPANDAGKGAVDFNTRMKDGSITVREALSLVADSTSDKTKAGKDNIKKTRNLIAQLADEGIDVDQPYFDVYKTREFNAALDPLERADGVNRWQEWIWFERRFKDRVEDAGRNEPFTLLGGDKGYAQRTYELVGVQSRGADPMRGTLFSEDLDRIYNEALNQDTYEKVTKTGKTVTVDIDPETRDYLIYEKYTGQRLASNIDKDTGLKITDINFGTDADGNLIAEVAGKTVGKKTRPEAMYDGEFAHFLKAKVDRALAALPEGADPSKANLFQTTDAKLDALWNATIRPKLEAEFSAILPKGKQGSRSVIRKILARQLLVEYKFPKDAVKAWMGHAGAEMSGSGDILTESYTGQVPDNRIGGMTNTLIRNDARNAGTSTVNQLFLNRRVDVPNFYGDDSIIFSTPDTIDIASASQPAKGRDPLPGELQELNETARSNALDLEMANIEKEKRNLQLRKENQAVEEETIRQKVRQKYNAKLIEKDELARIAAETGEDIDAGAEKQLTAQPSEKLANKMAKFGIKLGAAATTVISTITKAASPVLPIVGFEGTKQEMLKRGASPGEAIAQATAEELSGPASIIGPVSRGLADATIAGAEKGLEEQYGYKGPVTLEAIDKIGAGLISGGRFKFPNFASGGFIEKKGD